MKKVIYIIMTVILCVLTAGCTDNFDETNTNKDKFYTTDVQNVFAGTVYRTLNVMGQMNYTQFSNYSRGVTVSYTSVSLAEGDMTNYFRQFYVDILRDLIDMEKKYDGIPGCENRTMILKTWKAYIYSVIASTWGVMPMSDAMMTYAGKLDYKYDSEREIYIEVLNLLKAASEGFIISPPIKDDLRPDPIFPKATSVQESDITKWRKFANTLRLDVALRIQNMDRALADQHIKECMEHEDWLISAVDEAVQPSWGTDVNRDASYYYNRFLKGLTDTNLSESTYPRIGQYMFTYMQSYHDPRLEKYVDRPAYADRFVINDTITRPSSIDSTGTMRDSVVSRHSVPYVPAYEIPRAPQTWEVPYNPQSNKGQGTERYQFPYNGSTNKCWAYVNKSFLKEDAKMVILSWASTCFMKAEAKLRFGYGSKTAQQYYEDGIAASFTQYGIGVSELNTYMKQDGIKWDTNGKGMSDYMQIYYADINGKGGDDNHFEQIVKQRWFAEYFNGFAGWVLERRTRVLNFPPMFYNGSPGLEGSNNRFDFPAERFIYSNAEMVTNADEYYKAINLLQANSPKGDLSSRWGDNLWTTLQFAKVNPALATAEEQWSNRTFIWNQDILQKQYGNTEEEMIQIAQREFPAVNDSTTLGIYLKYTVNEILSTYDPANPNPGGSNE